MYEKDPRSSRQRSNKKTDRKWRKGEIIQANQRRKLQSKHLNGELTDKTGKVENFMADTTCKVLQGEDKSWLFPDNTIIAVHIITLILRLYIVSQKWSWWILHPDEIYQSLEGM